MDVSKTVATDIPPNPPDFRLFSLDIGNPFVCPADNGKRFRVSLSETAVTLECDSCHKMHVLIVNKLAE